MIFKNKTYLAHWTYEHFSVYALLNRERFTVDIDQQEWLRNKVQQPVTAVTMYFIIELLNFFVVMLTLRNTVTADVDMKDILSKMNDSQPLLDRSTEGG